MSRCFICDRELELVLFDKYGVAPCSKCKAIIMETLEDMNKPRKKDPWDRDQETGEIENLDEEEQEEDEYWEDDIEFEDIEDFDEEY